MSKRNEKAKKNIIANVVLLLFTTMLTFVTRTIFINNLGEEALGLSGLYSNILSMLNLSELGLSTTIGYSLYKKLADNDYNSIGALMTLYKKIYRILGTIILLVGLSVIPFIPQFISGNIVSNYQIIFIFYLLDVVCSYFISYKDILIISDQNNYKALLIRFVSVGLMYFFEIMMLHYTQNFVYYTIAFFVTNNFGKWLLNYYITKKYKYIDFNSKLKVENQDKKIMKVNIRALLFHKIGDYLVNSTDNILISKIVNLATVGFYANYLSLISVVKSLISTIYSSITSSLGNLIAKENTEVQEKVFNIINFASYVFGSTFAICFFYCADAFVIMWIGAKYVLSETILFIITLNFYIYTILLPVNSYKDAAGLYNPDKYIAIIQAIINLGGSIILGIKLGLMGILLGTTISYIVTVLWYKPLILYKYVLKADVFFYFKGLLKNSITLSISFLLSFFIINNGLKTKNVFLTFLTSGIISFIINILIILLFYRKTTEFQYLINNIKSMVHLKIKKGE